MLYHLDYPFDKQAHKDYWIRNYQRGHWRPSDHPDRQHELILWHLFDVDEMAEPMIHDLNLVGLNIKPRYRYVMPNTEIRTHIDIDGIIGLNFNILRGPLDLVFDGETVEYEQIVANFGGYNHSVPAAPDARLIFKLSVRAPWEEVVERLDESGYLLGR